MAADPNSKPDLSSAAASEDREKELGGRMTFIEHLEELRYRIIVSLATIVGCFLVLYLTATDTLKEYFTQPLRQVLQDLNSEIIITGMAEGFVFELKLTAVAAVFVSLPMIFYQLWAFVAPGLYKHERRYIGPFIIFSTVLFVAGAAFFYFIVFPIAAAFFASFSQPGEITWTPKLNDVFSFVMMMILAFGVIFEMPLVVFILARLNLISDAFLRRYRKYAIVIILVIAAIITPPDFLSQLLIGIPMWLLYEISVLVARIFGPKSKAADPS